MPRSNVNLVAARGFGHSHEVLLTAGLQLGQKMFCTCQLVVQRVSCLAPSKLIEGGFRFAGSGHWI